MKTEFAYDSLPYSNNVFAQTHPDGLCASAKLFGLAAPEVEKSRVLEIGCGNGMNLISHAYGLPKAEFVGIDLAKSHIDYANNSVSELGLKNIEFRQIDLMEMSAGEFGKFDYIIAHGLFSWIPPAVREKTLSIYREMLGENGVGFLSYNTYPGWFYTRMVSEIGKIHTQDIEKPLEKIQRAKEFIKFLGENTVQKDVYKFILQNEFYNLENKDAAAIFHDNLSGINQPFYFYEFAEMLAENGFQFLAEAELFSMFLHNSTPEAKRFLEEIDDFIWRQQYLDFLKGRSFRQTLFCRKNFELNRNPQPEILDALFIASGIKAESENSELDTAKPENFIGLDGRKIEINHPLTKTALCHLQEIWGDSVLFSELLKISQNKLQEKGFEAENWEKHLQITRTIFMQLVFQTDLIEIHTYRPGIFTKVSEKPELSKLARWQLTKGDLISTNYGRVLKIEDFLLRHLLENTDGNKSLKEINEAMRKFITSSDEIGNKREVLNNLPMMMNIHLKQFASAGIFVR